MAFTKVVGAGIHTLAQLQTHNIHSAGIVTATKFVGEMESGGGDSTFQNVTIAGNLTVNGTTTTLDTDLMGVDKLEVAANNTTVGAAITQSGSGGILRLFDSTTQVFSVEDGGAITASGSITANNTLTVAEDITIKNAKSLYLANDAENKSARVYNSAGTGAANLTFMTVPSGGSEATRLKLTSTGQVRIDGSTSANHGLRFTPGGWNGYDNRMGFCGTSGADFWWSSNWNPTDGSRDHSSYSTNYIRQSATGNGITFGTGDTNVSASERLKITKDGKVGVNLTQPQTVLNVKGCISTGRNLAREVGTIINISSSYSGTRNGVSVINGQKNYEEDTNADWITANGQRANANLTIDLGAQYTCDRFVIYNQNEYANNVREVKNFTLEGSNDNSSWTTVLDDEAGASYGHEPNPGWSFHMPANNFDDVEGVTYRYWKFTMKTYHGSTTLGGVMELELYEASNATHSEITSHSVVATDIYARTIHHEAPAFFACRNTSFSIPNQSTTLVQFVDNQGPGFDTNGCWDNSNYRFVPNVPGYYSINMLCSVSYGSLQAGRIYIFKNGSSYAMSQLYLNGGDSYDDISMSCSTLVFLNGTGDYIDGRAWRNGGNGGLGDNEINQQISGFLARSAGPRVHGAGYA